MNTCRAKMNEEFIFEIINAKMNSVNAMINVTEISYSMHTFT